MKATMRLVYYLEHQVTTYSELQILYGSNYTIYISATITSHDLILKDHSSKVIWGGFRPADWYKQEERNT